MFPPTTEVEARKVLLQFTDGHRLTAAKLFSFILEVEFLPGGLWNVRHEMPEDDLLSGNSVEAVAHLIDLVTIDGNAPATAAELVERLENWS